MSTHTHPLADDSLHCESCGMPVESGTYCQFCTDADGNLQAFEERAWQVDPDHPDIDAGNEADMLRQFFARANALEDVKRRPEDFRRWMDESVENSARLFEQVAQGDRAGAAESLQALAQSCAACHTAYRN